MEPHEIRRVKRQIQVWKANLPETWEHIPPEPIVPIGDPIVVEPFEEFRLVRRTRADAMVLVAWAGSLYLVNEDDLEERTIRVFKSFRR